MEVTEMSESNRVIRCPHCGFELPIDDLYMEALKEEFRERNDERLQEAIRSRRRRPTGG